MSRRSRAKAEEAFSLFPFLAVLLCTMGTLALVFVLIAQKATGDDGDDERAGIQAVDFDNDAGLADVAQYGAIVSASELAATMNGGLNGDRRKAVDSLADHDGLDETRDNETDDAYEQALVKTGAASIEEVIGEKESVEWFLQELDEINSHSDEIFEEERLRLANAEAGIAKLREEAEVARLKYEALVRENGAGKDSEELKNRIAELDREIEKLQEEAANLRDKNANAKKSYSIVPYQGKKGTFRRPIYVECKESGVFIEPEGVRFDERDFLLAQYPGNPFDTALRAAAQRYLVTGGQKTATGETIEPYPLIIVRPSGARYFYAAIAALASWDQLYGYEFVEEDQELAYPQPDPVLAKLAQDQADLARRRMQVQLAAALSVRNAQIVSEERMRRNARRGGMGTDNEATKSELQSRLGSNVRLGAANPLAGSGATARSGVGGGAPRGVTNAGTLAGAPVRGGTGAPVMIASTQPAGSGMGAYGSGGGGVFTGAANNVVSATGDGSATTGGELVPAVPYTGQYAQNMVPRPDGEISGVGENGETAPSGASESAGGNAGAGGEQVALNDGGDAQNASNANPIGDETSGEAMNANGYLSKEGQAPPHDATQFVANTASQAPQGDNIAPQYMKNFVETPETTQKNDSTTPRDLSNTLGNTTFAAGATGDQSDGAIADSATMSSSQPSTATNGATGASSGNDSGETSGMPNIFTKSVDLNEPPEPQKEIREDEKTPQEAFLVSRELTRTATRGSERGIVVRCTARGYVFPKQPGLRASYNVPYATEGKTRQDRDAELADVVTLCVKSWGVAGRNMYWAPYMKAEVVDGGETGFKELQEFCSAQGITLVQTSPNESKSTKR